MVFSQMFSAVRDGPGHSQKLGAQSRLTTLVVLHPMVHMSRKLESAVELAKACP